MKFHGARDEKEVIGSGSSETMVMSSDEWKGEIGEENGVWNGLVYIQLIFERLKNWNGPDSISGGERCPFVDSQE